jgi:ribosome-binding ATPase YchF (GTP1/OBG family)
VSSFAFVTQKPILCVRNVGDDRAAGAEPLHVDHAVSSIALCASLEAEIAMLEPADRPAFLAELGLKEPARDRLIRTCYDACGLISFLTAGEKEVRAWTIEKGSLAPQAAGKIHSDFEKGFIKAEVIAYEDFVQYKGEKGAMEKGKMRHEGKNYIVCDGDVIYFRFSKS